MRSAEVTVVLESTVRTGGQGDLEAFLVEAIPYYELPGGITVSLHWDRDAPERFREVIEYVDRETYERDQLRVDADPGMGALLARWHQLLATDLTVTIWTRSPLTHHPASEPRPT